MNRSEVESSLVAFQRQFIEAIELIDGSASFGRDRWERPAGGGGVTRVMTGGRHIEKAAVNFSAVSGETPSRLSEQLAAASSTFFATGVSIIVHPLNPHAPTFHANIRYFETESAAWFGGGADLTPYYLYPEDAAHFHEVLKGCCDRHDVADYATWKTQCDDYFRLPHRNEARGVGGIFYDHLTRRLDEVWAFQQDLATHLIAAYTPVLSRRIDVPYGEREKTWHELRRGRYVEFNLVLDRGTRFGLETDGRTESILASLPPRARWDYAHEPEPGSAEAEMLHLVRSAPREWAS